MSDFLCDYSTDVGSGVGGAGEDLLVVLCSGLRRLIVVAAEDTYEYGGISVGLLGWS